MSKILFTDLDGTLLNDEKKITPGSRRAIEAALAQGHRVVIASGRPLCGARKQAQRLGLDGPGCYIIAYNGGVLYDCCQKRELLRQSIPLEALYALFQEASRQHIHIQTYTDTAVAVERTWDDAILQEYRIMNEMDVQVVEDIRQALERPPVKALIIGPQARGEAMSRWIQTNLGDTLDSFFSSRSYLEVVRKGVSKGQAVTRLCQLLEIPMEQAVAVGDEANDIPMLQAAGVGVAMANAIPETKAAAAYITAQDNNHDGVAEVVERFLLT